MVFSSLGLFLLLVMAQATSPSGFTLLADNSRNTPKDLHASVPSWLDLESMIDHNQATPPISIDSVLQPEKPNYSRERPTLFRERHGWCPYSERVWLALELLNIDYDTIRIDNTGGGKPSYYGGGTTPQIKWPSGRMQGESMDLVEALDDQHYIPNVLRTKESRTIVSKFRSIFPSRARPSSRAAFLFQGNGDPLWKSAFEETLKGTNELLKSNGSGPFFLGSEISAADIAWAPFLERYRYQLPCLHQGLDPFDASKYAHLHAWYHAMETQVPAYACRIKGNASSWRKVLTMTGFGNAGNVPVLIDENMRALEQEDFKTAADTILHQELWDDYASVRPHVAATPHAEAGSILIRNRSAILKDAAVRAMTSGDDDKALRELAGHLLEGHTRTTNHAVRAWAAFLDQRMCVPRDMGAMSAAAITLLAYS